MGHILLRAYEALICMVFVLCTFDSVSDILVHQTAKTKRMKDTKECKEAFVHVQRVRFYGR